jgi:glycosyltransferase involved in cell wall biosynthesis
LNQEGLEDYEIVIVNDGSKDKTAEIVKNFSIINKKVRLIDLKENKGRGFARFIGVKESKGDCIAFIDADIILPSDWLKVCLLEIKDYDAVGGIAVPDGDVNYIWRKSKVKPKIIKGTTEITGSNGIYKKSILDKINYNSSLKEGEDFDLNNRLKERGFKLKSITSLIVEHRETKSYGNSLKWLYQSGKGATKLLKRYRKVRLPDLAFFGFAFLFLLTLLEIIFFNSFYFLIIILLYPLLTSFFHIQSRFKFEIKKTFNFISAVILNYLLIFSYYIGRIRGFI